MSTNASNKTKHEIDQEDIAINAECLACARAIIKSHTTEQKYRKRLEENGQNAPKRWQVSPAVAKSVLGLIPKLQEVRRVLCELPALIKPAAKKVSAKAKTEAVRMASISNLLLPKSPLLPG